MFRSSYSRKRNRKIDSKFFQKGQIRNIGGVGWCGGGGAGEEKIPSGY
jgi:hypothetical protein